MSQHAEQPSSLPANDDVFYYSDFEVFKPQNTPPSPEVIVESLREALSVVKGLHCPFIPISSQAKGVSRKRAGMGDTTKDLAEGPGLVPEVLAKRTRTGRAVRTPARLIE
jgi:hypothetical protein